MRIVVIAVTAVIVGAVLNLSHLIKKLKIVAELAFEMFCFFGGLLRIEFNRTRTEIVSEKNFA